MGGGISLGVRVGAATPPHEAQVNLEVGLEVVDEFLGLPRFAIRSAIWSHNSLSVFGAKSASHLFDEPDCGRSDLPVILLSALVLSA